MDDRDAVFKALADATRRAILDELRRGSATTGELCAAHPEMTRFGVMDHLRVLHEAGLILVERTGRSRLNHLNPVPLREVYARWLRPIAETPADELLALRRTAEARAKTIDVRDVRPERARAARTGAGRSA
jgi:DNA-binding transcriptional ArsR family regulator